MKICLELNHFKGISGAMGTERVMWSLTRGLLKLSHRVVWKAHKDCPSTIVTVVQEVSKDCDIVHSHEWNHQRNYSDISHKPYLITLHGGGIETDPLWLQRTRDNKDHIITTSKFISDRVGCPTYVHNCSDTDEYIFREKKQDYILWIAGLDWQNWGDNKGLWFTIGLAKKLRFKLKIAGAGGNKEVHDKIKSLVDANIEFVGYVNGKEKAELIANAKAMIIPTFLPEACTTTLSEALLSGTPVICSNYGGMPEQMIPEVGFVCAKEIDYVKAILNINKINPSDCYKYGVDNFSSIASAKKHLQIYANVLKYGSVGRK